MADIPTVRPEGADWDTIRLIIGIVVYVVGLLGLVAYLVWKLPHKIEFDEDTADDDSGLRPN